ncbi:ABC-type transport auxiliary lipoprotein family protein [Sphingomonas nostoxanthinifaciens]|uniref:ABC-type transport auxiliary lipoprotein family protein n=1 Tax=Sphingomonas nostoxanthinifaciens TaxID=2872652 RepID=UPI001CC20249|nr:ABC-type transport auxiliary lipoprotein family protein [Sphingomonas nostoxanthinifaciens]UAK24787.1 PqiC family protein [Sphingomonas nostoxanthinifaciens]
MIRSRLACLALIAALPLAGCVRFGAKPPASLMTLAATQPLAPGNAISTDDAHAVAVMPLSAVAVLGTQRVLVTDGATEVAYLKGGLWAAAPAVLFRSLVAETITTRTGRVVPGPRMLQSQPDTRLSGQVSSFGLDGPGHAAVVTFDAALTREGSPTLQSRRFSARVPVTVEDPAHVATAINQAANQVAAEVADWIGR